MKMETENRKKKVSKRKNYFLQVRGNEKLLENKREEEKRDRKKVKEK